MTVQYECSKENTNNSKKKYRDLNLQERGFLAKENVGRPKKIGEYDAEVQRYLRKLRSHGGKVNRGIAIAVATGILKKKTPLLLQVNASTPKQLLTNDWAHSLLRRMKFVKRKGTKAAKKVPENFVELGDQFKARIHSVDSIPDPPWDDCYI